MSHFFIPYIVNLSLSPFSKSQTSCVVFAFEILNFYLELNPNLK